MEIFTFFLGVDEFAFEVELIGSIMPVPDRYDAVPESPAYVKGWVVHRGQRLQVQDLRERFAYPGIAPGILLVLDDKEGKSHSFIVDDAFSPVCLRAAAYRECEPLPTGTQLDGFVAKCIKSQRAGTSLRGYYILDLNRLR